MPPVVRHSRISARIPHAQSEKVDAGFHRLSIRLGRGDAGVVPARFCEVIYLESSSLFRLTDDVNRQEHLHWQKRPYS